jgi:hypothetical protein
MVAAISSPVSSPMSANVARLPLAPHNLSPPSPGRRQQRQRFLEWDRDEAGEERGDARWRAAMNGPALPALPSERSPIGPRRMAEVMPDVLARYGLTF